MGLLTVLSCVGQYSRFLIMRRLSLFWISWFFLEATLLNPVAAFSLGDPRLASPLHLTFSLAQSYPDCEDWRFRNTSSISHILMFQCERQGKQVPLPVSFRAFLPQRQGSDPHLYTARFPVFFLTPLFPRKLLPPSATDEPFLG